MTDSVKGHIVKDGVVTQCPFITLSVTMTPAKEPDRYV